MNKPRRRQYATYRLMFYGPGVWQVEGTNDTHYPVASFEDGIAKLHDLSDDGCIVVASCNGVDHTDEEG